MLALRLNSWPPTSPHALSLAKPAALLLSLHDLSLSLTMRHICCGLVNSNSSAAAAAPVVVVVFCWLSLVRLDCSLIIYTRLCLAHFILGIFA